LVYSLYSFEVSTRDNNTQNQISPPEKKHPGVHFGEKETVKPEEGWCQAPEAHIKEKNSYLGPQATSKKKKSYHCAM
jgi:hypothetical protein